jgi:hopanoid biosynthesis associated RND transporter like protein HpnN
LTQLPNEWGKRALGRWIDAVQYPALIVVLAAVALAAAGLGYTLHALAINTDTVEMISEEVPFRQHRVAFNRAFPQFQNTIVAVLDGPTPEQVDEAAEALAAALSARPELFRSVHLPGGGPFFERNGLLFLTAGELARLADRLAVAEPLLASLAQDPSLRGLVEVLDLVLEHAHPDEAAELAHLLGRMAEVVRAAEAGRPLSLSWQTLLTGTRQAGPAGVDGGPTPRFVIVQPHLDYASLAPAAAAIAEIRRQAAALDIEAARGVRLRLTGDATLNAEELESVKLGGKTAALLSFALVVALLVWRLRSARLIVATVVTLLIGLVWTATFAALAVGHLNLLSVAFAALFVGLGDDFSNHLSLRYREEAARDGDRAVALRRAALGVGGALALSAVSAAAGFYAFLPTDYRGLAELGLISGTGMFIALVASLTVLPALIALGPPRGRLAGRPYRTPLGASLVQRYRRPVLAASAACGLVGVAVLPLVRFDSNPINLKDPRAESVAAFLDLAKDPRTTPYAVDVVAASLAEAQGLAARLTKLPAVERALTLASFVPNDQDEKLAIIDDVALFLGAALAPSSDDSPPVDAGARRAAIEQLRARLAAVASRGGKDDPAPLAAAAARLGAALDGWAEDGAGGGLAAAALADLERRLTAHLPQTLRRLSVALSAQPVELADVPEELRRRWLTDGGLARVEAYPAGDMTSNREMARFADAVLAVAPSATGTPVIVTEAGEAVVAAFIEASVLALVLITAILAMVLRRLGDVVMVLAPLILAALVTAAASVLLNLPFNFANVIVLPLILGLGVSGGIHFVMRRREEGGSGRVLASSTPRAVLFSALTTVVSFGSLALSGHRGMTSMGQLLTLGIGFTLLAILVVLPSLMAATDGAGERRAAGEEGH